MNLKTLMLGASTALAMFGFASAETITIATVNNGDMIRMQKLTDDFTAKNPDIQLEWVTLEENVLREVTRFFPKDTEDDPGAGEIGDMTKILVLPSLPTAEPFRTQSVEMLKERGVDAIISFRAMLLDIIDKIEPNRNYGKSDTLQVIRILKNYDLLKEAQLEMFMDRTGAASRSAARPGRPPA